MAIFSGIKELGLLLFDHRRFATQRTLKGRRFFHKIYRSLHFPTYQKRRRLRDAIGEAGETLQLENEKGFALWRPRSFPLLEQAIAEANAIFDGTDLEHLTRSMPEQAPFASVSFELRADSAIGRLAVHPRIIKPFADYVGVIPLLHAAQLMYSPNHRLVQGTSQFYHLDGQDVKSLQVFVYLHDVTEENGPLTLVSAAETERIANALGYRKAGGLRRISDDAIAKFVDVRHNVHVLTGEKGSVLVFDGDRCFHFGSRKATKPRRILHYAYLSPFAFTLPRRWWKRFDHLVPDEAPEWQRSVVRRT